MKNKAVFSDRDGVVNELIYHKEMSVIDSPFTIEQYKLLPDVGKAINIFHELGFKVIIVSNQPGMAKDSFSREAFENIREKMNIELKKQGAFVDAELCIKAHRKGLNIAEVVIEHLPRQFGGNNGGKPRIIFTALCDLIRQWGSLKYHG